MPNIPGQVSTAAVRAAISIAEVPYDDSLGKVKQIGPISDFMIHHHYERDGHTYMAGLTSPEPFNGATVGVVCLGGPTVLWIAEWTSSTVGEHPPIPDPTPPNGWRLLDINATLAMVSDGPSAIDPVYRISGTYVYARIAPESDIKRFLTGEITYPYAPWLQDGYGRKVPASVLGSNLLDMTGGGSGTTTGQGAMPLQGSIIQG